MTRVLVLCEYPSLNGGERSLLAVAERLDAEGLDLHVAAPPHGPLGDALRRFGIPIWPFEFFGTDTKRLSQSRLRERLSEVMQAASVNLVHANSVAMSRLSGPVTRAAGTASIGHLRDIIRLSRAAMGHLNCHRRLLAVSSATRDWYASCGLDSDKTVVEFNGVDLHRFRPRPSTGYLHDELGISRAIRLIGNIGQIGMRKGVDVFLEAAEFVAQRVDTVHFLVVGQRYSDKHEAREYETRVRRMAARKPLDNRVHFLGIREDIDHLLGELTLYVHAARQEPLGRVLLECSATGIPVIATDVGGTREIFPVDSHAAILVEPDSPRELAAEVIGLLADPTRQRTIGTSARRRAESCFDVRHAARRLARHYLDLTA